MTRLYLAYGSNMNKAQMARRCPAAKPIKVLMIDDCRLVFRGYADIEFRAGEQTPMVLWQITAACEVALDKYEGVAAKNYKRVEIPLDNGEFALTYVMCDGGVWPPQQEYYERIRAGYEAFGIDLEPLEVALKRSHHDKQHSAATRRRMVKHISNGRNIVERKPTHIPLSRINSTTESAQTETRLAADDGICKHGWPHGVCEDCANQETLLPLPKPDPRYDGYNWSERAKAGTAKRHDKTDASKLTKTIPLGKGKTVVYSARETETPAQEAARLVRERPRRKPTQVRETLDDWMKRKGYH